MTIADTRVMPFNPDKVWKVALIQEYMSCHINVAHYNCAYDALDPIPPLSWKPTKVRMERKGEYKEFSSYEEFTEWVLDDSTDEDA